MNTETAINTGDCRRSSEMETFGFDETMLGKRARLLSAGLNPYPYAFRNTMPIRSVVQEGQREGDAVPTRRVRVAGRIWSRRPMGKTWFLDLRDQTGKIQLYLTRELLSPETWECLPQLDIGDIVGVEGDLFRTRAGELSVRAHIFEILSKVVVPIPVGKEFDGQVRFRIADPESRYRERYLYWMLNDEDRERIRTRARIISAIRRRMESAGFLEVLTPTIEPIYGGAEARPFRTSIWALDDHEAFLRISPELYLKRYIVAGFEKVFSICQNFRNEGIDHSHNPEFSMMEWYEAYTDYEDQMARFERLVADICVEICGSACIGYQGVELDFTPPWRRLTMLDGIREYARLDASNLSAQELSVELQRRGCEIHSEISWGEAVAELFELCCEEHLVQPTFVLDHPVEISPLTKLKRGENRLVERFEPFVFRMEIGNAYSELTDPVEQCERLGHQRRELGNGYENHPLDADFVRAIGCGMPPTGGVGLGIDRLIMLLTNAVSIRDIIPFPMVKRPNSSRIRSVT